MSNLPSQVGGAGCGKGGLSSQPGSSFRVLACAAPGWRTGGLGRIPDGHIDPIPAHPKAPHLEECARHILCRVPAGPPPRMYSCFQTASPTNSFKCPALDLPGSGRPQGRVAFVEVVLTGYWGGWGGGVRTRRGSEIAVVHITGVTVTRTAGNSSPHRAE